MGDAADYFDETGIAAWEAHKRGECEMCCPYCAEDDEEIEERD